MTVMKAFDPRDPDQSETAPATWKPTENPVLILATMHLMAVMSAPPLFGVPPVNREWLALMADYCDQPVDHPMAAP